MHDIIYWGTQLGIAEMLRSGTTCFSDMYFFMEQTAKAVQETGIRAVLSRGLAGVAPTADKALVENKELFTTWNGYDDNRFGDNQRIGGQHRALSQYAGQVLGQSIARVETGEDTDEGDAYLDGGEELVGLLRQAEHVFGCPAALLGICGKA